MCTWATIMWYLDVYVKPIQAESRKHRTYHSVRDLHTPTNLSPWGHAASTMRCTFKSLHAHLITNDVTLLLMQATNSIPRKWRVLTVQWAADPAPLPSVLASKCQHSSLTFLAQASNVSFCLVKGSKQRKRMPVSTHHPTYQTPAACSEVSSVGLTDFWSRLFPVPGSLALRSSWLFRSLFL